MGEDQPSCSAAALPELLQPAVQPNGGVGSHPRGTRAPRLQSLLNPTNLCCRFGRVRPTRL